MSIYFGSQTGTAEGFARTLMEEGRAAGFDTKTMDLEEFDPAVLAETKVAIFLMATYGEGQPTDNAVKFMDWVHNKDRSVGADFLAGLRYSVFGLGNRQYEHFNRTGRTCNEWLGKLGANVIVEYGEGDDDATLEEDFEAWKAHLWTGLRKGLKKLTNPNYSSADDLAAMAKLEEQLASNMTKPQHEYSVEVTGRVAPNSAEARALHQSALQQAKQGKFHNSTKHFVTSPEVTVLVNRELRNTAFVGLKAGEQGSTRHIELDIRGTGLNYHTADNLAILPENNAEDVARLASHLGYDLQDVISFSAAEEHDFRPMYPNPCSISDLFTLYLDIHGQLRHATLKALERFVNAEEERAWLHGLLQHKDALKKFCEQENASLFMVLLQYLPTTRLPLVDFLHLVAPIQPRYYTISSSSSLHPHTIHATVSITEYEVQGSRGEKRVFQGLCTGYLSRLASGYDKLRVFVRASTFRLPKTLQPPVLLIGPGTGIAPMRALLQERSHLLASHVEGAVGKSRLFFGCKYSQYDYLYADELQAFKENKTLDELHLAISRENAQKVYVQTLLKAPEVARAIVDSMFEEGGYVYVCGATAMGNDVLTLFIQLIQEHKHISHAQATEEMKSWQDAGRYVQELWTA